MAKLTPLPEGGSEDSSSNPVEGAAPPFVTTFADGGGNGAVPEVNGGGPSSGESSRGPASPVIEYPTANASYQIPATPEGEGSEVRFAQREEKPPLEKPYSFRAKALDLFLFTFFVAAGEGVYIYISRATGEQSMRPLANHFNASERVHEAIRRFILTCSIADSTLVTEASGNMKATREESIAMWSPASKEAEGSQAPKETVTYPYFLRFVQFVVAITYFNNFVVGGLSAGTGTFDMHEDDTENEMTHASSSVLWTITIYAFAAQVLVYLATNIFNLPTLTKDLYNFLTSKKARKPMWENFEKGGRWNLTKFTLQTLAATCSRAGAFRGLLLLEAKYLCELEETPTVLWVAGITAVLAFIQTLLSQSVKGYNLKYHPEKEEEREKSWAEWILVDGFVRKVQIPLGVMSRVLAVPSLFTGEIEEFDGPGTVAKWTFGLIVGIFAALQMERDFIGGQAVPNIRHFFFGAKPKATITEVDVENQAGERQPLLGKDKGQGVAPPPRYGSKGAPPPEYGSKAERDTYTLVT